MKQTMTKEQILGKVMPDYTGEPTYTMAEALQAMDDFANQQLSAERERYDELKSKYDALVMDNMTHEYNAAEAQRHLPDLIKQYVDCERERAGKLVEALKNILAWSAHLPQPANREIIKAKQTLNDYEKSSKGTDIQ